MYLLKYIKERDLKRLNDKWLKPSGLKDSTVILNYSLLKSSNDSQSKHKVCVCVCVWGGGG